jgi:hypothetical protein
MPTTYIVVALGDVIARDKKCEASTCKYDATILREMVADLEDDQRDDNDYDDGPEAEELGG